jgi:Zn-finger nucleic acid-binding protein
MYAENTAGDKTEWQCPVCEPKKRLMSRRLGSYQIAVLECQRCAGLWLGLEALQAMLSAEARGENRNTDAPRGTSVEASRAIRRYRPCVVCGELMTRRNLARGKSGIVADLCGHHGVWFDADELGQLIAWSRTGGLEDLRRDIARMVGSTDEVRKRHALEEVRAKELPSVKMPQVRAHSDGSMIDLDNDQESQWLTVLGMVAMKLLTRR